MSQGTANQRMTGAGRTGATGAGTGEGAADEAAGVGEAAVAATPASGSPIDREHLDRHTFGNPDLAREVLGLFARQAEQFGARLAERDAPEVLARVVHTLKGSARGVGAWRVAGEAEGVEAVLRTGQAADLTALRDALGEARDFIAMQLDAE